MSNNPFRVAMLTKKKIGIGMQVAYIFQKQEEISILLNETTITSKGKVWKPQVSNGEWVRIPPPAPWLLI